MSDDVSKGHDTATVIRQPDNYDPEKANAARIEAAEKQKALEAHVNNMIEHDKLDPRQQYYLKNAVTGKLIRTNAMYHRAEENRQPLVQITYNQAYALYREEEAAKKAAMKAHVHRKRAKQARKKNRG